jgi:multiple sugar transport system permease protein
MKKLIGTQFVLGCLALFFCLPPLLLFVGSIKGFDELTQNIGPVLGDVEGMASYNLFPRSPTLKNFVELLFDRPEFYVVFANTIKIVGLTLVGQILLGAPAAWAFASFSFGGKKLLFTLYIVLMMLPFQVTMLSSYIVLNNIGLIDTHWSLILPGIFSTFPVFLMYRSFSGIPKELHEAAAIDGAGQFQTFFYIGIPIGASGILSAVVLGFLEYFSLVEQPLSFLKDKSLWTLSLYLPEIGLEQVGYAFAAAMVTLMPALFVFLFGQEYLEKGIIASAIKG